MNSETGKAYRDVEAVDAAEARGETLVPISERAAANIEAGRRAQADSLRRLRSHRGITNDRRPPSFQYRKR